MKDHEHLQDVSRYEANNVVQNLSLLDIPMNADYDEKAVCQACGRPGAHVCTGAALTMSEQQGKTCKYPGPHGQNCFLLEGHKGRHRAASVFEWNSGEPTFNLTQKEAREAAAFRAMAEHEYFLRRVAGRWCLGVISEQPGELALISSGTTPLAAVEAAMAKVGQTTAVAKAKCQR